METVFFFLALGFIMFTMATVCTIITLIIAQALISNM